MSRTAFELSQAGQHAYSFPKNCSEFQSFIPPKELLRKLKAFLPEISELDLTRHFSKLASQNVGIDNVFYPLGSCTMKLNPRISEHCAAFPGFSNAHPLAPPSTVQGNLEVIYEMIQILCNICGMDGGTLLPCAGAHGEYTGIRMIAEYHKKRGDIKRREVLIPEDAHGTNPASAAMAGLDIVPVRVAPSGQLDMGHLRELLSDRTFGLMLTNPNTLGLFIPNILSITKEVHEAGGLLYYDGANLNAIMNVVRPGDMGFDVMHINLHKTFATPHGGGGPGSGPVLCKEILKPFLPVPKIEIVQGKYEVNCKSKDSIGRISSFYGNFLIYLRAYLYAKLHGSFGLRRVAENAVLNANYLKKRIAGLLTVPYPNACMHEFVVQADDFLNQGVRAIDIAKRLLDYGVYAPTVYFPLIVKECLLIEPTETESKATLDHFVDIVSKIVEEIHKNPKIVQKAPLNKSICRPDEVSAAKHPILKHTLETMSSK